MEEEDCSNKLMEMVWHCWLTSCIVNDFVTAKDSIGMRGGCVCFQVCEKPAVAMQGSKPMLQERAEAQACAQTDA